LCSECHFSTSLRPGTYYCTFTLLNTKLLEISETVWPHLLLT